MMEALTTLGSLIAALGNTQSAAVLREHLALVKTQLDVVTKDFVKLQDEATELKSAIADLVQKNAELSRELASKTVSEEWFEISGTCFRKLPSGKYDSVPRCPNCHNVLSRVVDNKRIPFTCANKSCSYEVYVDHKLADLLKLLPKDES